MMITISNWSILHVVGQWIIFGVTTWWRLYPLKLQGFECLKFVVKRSQDIGEYSYIKINTKYFKSKDDDTEIILLTWVDAMKTLFERTFNLRNQNDNKIIDIMNLQHIFIVEHNVNLYLEDRGKCLYKKWTNIVNPYKRKYNIGETNIQYIKHEKERYVMCIIFENSI